MHNNISKFMDEVPSGTSQAKKETCEPSGSVGGTSEIIREHPDETSGLQRVLTRTQKRNLRKRLQVQKKELERAPITIEDSGCKRPKSEMSAPSPRSTSPEVSETMEPKLHSKLFINSANSMTVAVVKESLPLQHLNSSENFKLQEESSGSVGWASDLIQEHSYETSSLQRVLTKTQKRNLRKRLLMQKKESERSPTAIEDSGCEPPKSEMSFPSPRSTSPEVSVAMQPKLHSKLVIQARNLTREAVVKESLPLQQLYSSENFMFDSSENFMLREEPSGSVGWTSNIIQENSCGTSGLQRELTKTQKRNFRRRLQKKESARASTTNDYVGCKRPRSEMSPPSPRSTSPEVSVTMQPKLHSKLFIQTTNSMREAVVKESLPVQQLYSSENFMLREEPSGSVGWTSDIIQEHSCGTSDFKKVLTKTQRRNFRRRLQKKESARASTTNDYVGCRRPRSELSTPSSGSTYPKVSATIQPKLHSKLFIDAAKSTKVAVVKDSFPFQQLNSSENIKIQEEILKKMDLIPDGERLPRLNSPTVADGALVFHCDDTWTVEWLRKELQGSKEILDGVVLRVIFTSELLKPIKVAFKTKDWVNQEPKDLLRRISRYNPRLKSEGWRVLDKLVEPQSIRWIFEVGTESAKEILAAECQAYTGLDKGIFKILKGLNVPTPPAARY